MAAMKTCCMIWSVASAALGIVAFHEQVRAQASGCVVLEVAVEDHEALTQRSPPIVDKPGKENEPKGLAQQDAAAPISWSAATAAPRETA
jgi:hypothetical protein